jgi:hypothetical protein
MKWFFSPWRNSSKHPSVRAWHKDLYLVTQTLKRDKTSIVQAGFEPAFPELERLQTHALGGVANGIGS